MAALMTGYAETGLTTAKFVRRRKSDGAFWRTTTGAFEAYAAGNIANYGIAATETGSTGIYTATDPAEAAEGDYLLVKAAGANLAVSDLVNGSRWQDRAGPASDAVLSRLSAGQVTIISVVAQSSNITLIRGDDYFTADGRNLTWTDSSAAWPNLTGATLALKAYAAGTLTLTASGSITSPTGPATLSVELTAAQTAALANDTYLFVVVATLASSSHVVTLVRGQATVLQTTR